MRALRDAACGASRASSRATWRRRAASRSPSGAAPSTRWRWCCCSAGCAGRRRCGARCATAAGALWVSGLCWCVMYTAFMVALTLTTVANVLVTMAHRRRCSRRCSRASRWATGWRRAPGGRSRGRRRHRLDVRPARSAAATRATWLGTAVALARAGGRGHQLDAAAAPAAAAQGGGADMLPRCCWARCCRPLLTLPLALPLAASAHDLACWPCWAWCNWPFPACWRCGGARAQAPEISLLGLLEVVFGVPGPGWAPARRPPLPCSAAARWCSARWSPTKRWRCARARLA